MIGGWFYQCHSQPSAVKHARSKHTHPTSIDNINRWNSAFFVNPDERKVLNSEVIIWLLAAFILPMHWTSMFKVFTAAAWRQSCTTWAPTFRWRNSADLESEDRLPLKDRAPESSRWFIQHQLQNCGCLWDNRKQKQEVLLSQYDALSSLFQCGYVCRCNQELDEPVFGSHQWYFDTNRPNPRLSFAHIFKHPMTSPWIGITQGYMYIVMYVHFYPLYVQYGYSMLPASVSMNLNNLVVCVWKTSIPAWDIVKGITLGQGSNVKVSRMEGYVCYTALRIFTWQVDGNLHPFLRCLGWSAQIHPSLWWSKYPPSREVTLQQGLGRCFESKIRVSIRLSMRICKLTEFNGSIWGLIHVFIHIQV